MSTPADLRAALAHRLTADGTLTEPAWADAVRAVPRELFVGPYFVPVAGSFPTSYRTVRDSDPDWLDGIYSDTTLVTQLDGRTSPDDVPDGTITGIPTSSSTLPSVVLRMWQQLGAQAGQRVLEIGTGTGYSTALGAHRLGDTGLTSIEYDPAIAAAATTALKTAGYAPRLITGDGLRGNRDGGPYDRLIATCSVRYIPLAWLHQVTPGGRILATLSGWSYANALALLDVTGPGEATGRFMSDPASFMIARSHDRPPMPTLDLLRGQERPTRIDPAALDDWTGGWVAQLAAPSAIRTGAGAQQILWDIATGSQARTASDSDGGWTVTQRGPVRLWDKVEQSIQLWQDADEPHQGEFGITVFGGTQRVWLGSEAGPSWNLPI
ncbi:ATP-grasp peptide maturase system methyltransferase [Kitasatospora sp. NPDC056327]|uniref:ATP-grasp peptide maturase system methyltransferase n=1 Tax=Kitasatospora sp. NPDC056327 TaxID=3345785 RepID=UPI0035DD5357